MNRNKKCHVIMVGVLISMLFLGCTSTVPPRRRISRPRRPRRSPVTHRKSRNSRRLVDSSDIKKPAWTRKVPKSDNNYFYFIGLRTGAKKREDGMIDSKANAVRSIIEFLGQEGITKYESFREGDEIAIRAKVKLEGEGFVRGAKGEDSYWEEYEHRDKGETYKTYNVYVLLSYPKSEYEKALQEIEEKRRRKAEDEAREIEEMQKVVENMKLEVINLYNQGLTSLKRKMVYSSLVQLRRSKKKMLEYFPGRTSIEAGSQMLDISTIDTEMLSIMQKIELKKKDENIVYDIHGIANRNPTIYAYYISGSENIPVDDMPIKAYFDEDSGIVKNYPLKTLNMGNVEIPIEKITPTGEEVILNCEIDIEKIGFKDEDLRSPYISIIITRRSSLAYSINYFVNNTRKDIGISDSSIRAILMDSGYEIVKAGIKKQQVTENDVNRIGALNCEYLVLVTVEATGGEVEGMFYSNVVGKAMAYSFLDNMWVFELEKSSERGFGTSIRSASVNAYNRIKDDFIDAINYNIVYKLH